MRFIVHLLVILIWLVNQNSATAQDIRFMRSYYADDFRDWIFFDADDLEIGNLRARFQLKEDYSQWDFRVGELSGFILQRWNGKANEWEIRSGNTFITVTATWPGQFDSWRITAKDKVYYLNRDRDPQDFTWDLNLDQKNLCRIYNLYFRDPRDWEIEKFVETMDPALEMTALFLVGFYSVKE